MKAYGLERLQFGREYLIPKPFDDRVLIWEAAAVAKAAMDTGVARRPIDIDQYKVDLERRLGKARHTMRTMMNWAKRAPQRVVFPEGTTEKVLRAAHVIVDEGFARPILLGDRRVAGRAVMGDPFRSSRMPSGHRSYISVMSATGRRTAGVSLRRGARA